MFKIISITTNTPVKKLQKCIIELASIENDSHGTGFFLKKGQQYYLVTSDHVEIPRYLKEELMISYSRIANKVAWYPCCDVSDALQVSDKILQYDLLDSVVVSGYGFNQERPLVHKGSISDCEQDYFILNATAVGGMSGSPVVVNENGIYKVIAVVNSERFNPTEQFHNAWDELNNDRDDEVVLNEKKRQALLDSYQSGPTIEDVEPRLIFNNLLDRLLANRLISDWKLTNMGDFFDDYFKHCDDNELQLILNKITYRVLSSSVQQHIIQTWKAFQTILGQGIDVTVDQLITIPFSDSEIDLLYPDQVACLKESFDQSNANHIKEQTKPSKQTQFIEVMETLLGSLSTNIVKAYKLISTSNHEEDSYFDYLIKNKKKRPKTQKQKKESKKLAQELHSISNQEHVSNKRPSSREKHQKGQTKKIKSLAKKSVKELKQLIKQKKNRSKRNK
ncbi:hypothetical protein DID75_02450 [Candidatus Marinamargulisbacteria bacterium SCGC AG-410-N11]|nr:hypothetical protein DID75_02450 [Candidatus Marinamargulisbacteria bacterium SCGC AG-410-N11]